MNSTCDTKELLEMLHHYYMKRHSGTICFECEDGPVALSMKNGDVTSARGPHFDRGKGFSDLLSGQVTNVCSYEGVDNSPGHPVDITMEMVLFELASGRDRNLSKTLDDVRKSGKLPDDVVKTAIVEFEAIRTARQKIHLLEEGETVLGRSSKADFVIDDSTVSRRHALIRIANKRAEVLNLNDSNGTYLNRKWVVSEPLKEGDVLSMGETFFKFFWSDCGRGILFKLSEEESGPEDRTTIVIPKK